MLGDPRRQAFDQKVLAWMTEGSWEKDDARFDTLACELFEFQFAYCTGYGRFCEALGKTPSSISNYRDIPAVNAIVNFELPRHPRGAYLGLQRSASSQLRRRCDYKGLSHQRHDNGKYRASTWFAVSRHALAL